jgi:Tol biopolymer transport system component
MWRRLVLELTLVLVLTSGVLASSKRQESIYQGFTFSPDGSYLLAVHFDGTSSFIYKVPTTGGNATRLTGATGGFEGVPSFSADGKRIVYSFSPGREGGARIFTANADGTDAHPLVNSGTNDLGALLSPDDKTIVFMHYGYYGNYSPIARPAPHEWNFYASDLDGNNVRQITRGSYWMVSPASFSPDGRTLVFVDSFDDILLYPTKDANGQKVVLKPTLNGKKANAYCKAVFSSDGKSIIFTASYTSSFWGTYNYNVYRLDLGTHTVETLTTEKGDIGALAVSRDGQWVAFTHDEWKPHTATIFLLNLITRKMMPLTIIGIP